MENKTPNKLCVRCGTILNEHSKFCPKCGQAIECEKTEKEEIAPQKRTCLQCGTVLSDKSRFCPKCGESVTENLKVEKEGTKLKTDVPMGNDEPTKSTVKKRNKKIVVILMAVIVCIIALCGILGIFFTNRLSVVDIGDATVSRDSMQAFLDKNQYHEFSSGVYESSDNQVTVYLDEAGMPVQVMIAGGNTKIFGIGIGDTFTLEKTGKTLTSRGYGYNSDDEISITYSTDGSGGITAHVILYIDSENDKIFQIVYNMTNHNDIVAETETFAPDSTEASDEEGLGESISYPVSKDTFLWEDMNEKVTVCKVPKGESVIVTDDCGNGWFYAIYGDDSGFIRGEDFKSSDNVDEEANAGLFASHDKELSHGTYIYDDGSSIYSTAYIIEDTNGLRIDIDAMGYGGHQQGFANGYLIGLGDGTYSCIDDNDSGTFILKITDDGFDITAHPASGMEVMFSSIEGHYVFSGSGNAKADGYFEEERTTEKALSGKYEVGFESEGGAELEIVYGSGDDIYTAGFYGSYLDYAGGTSGFLVACADNVWDYYEDGGYSASMRLSYDGSDTIVVTSLDGATFGGMGFPGFSGTYSRTAEYNMP